MDFEIVSLNNSDFVRSIGKGLGKKIIEFNVGNFADSESYLKAPDTILKNKIIFVIQQFSFNKKTINEQLLELLFLTDLIKKMGAINIHAVLPYLPYSRQEKTYQAELVGPISLLPRLFEASCINKVSSFELHNSIIKNYFSIPLDEISLIDFSVNFFKMYKNQLSEGKDICFVSPDKGRAEFIKKIANILNQDFAFIRKVRKEKDEAKATELIGDVKNKNVIIIDDIIDTANTAISACDMVLNNGANSVIGFFAHAVLSKNSIEKVIKSNFKKIFITDTILTEDKLKNNDKIEQVSLVRFFIDFFKNNYISCP